VLSGVGVSVETIQSTGEHPGSPAGVFRFYSFACAGTNPPASVTVGFQLSGTATQGGGCGGSGDYTGEITSGTVTIPVAENQYLYTDVSFDAMDDQEVEDAETVIVTLDEGGDYAIAEIADDDVNVWVEATDDSASEDGRDPATFTIHREGGGGELAVYYTLGGNATLGVVDDEDGTITPDEADYVAGTPESGGNYFKVVIPSGQNAITVSVVPLNDSQNDEGTETITLTLASDQRPGGPFYNAPGNAGPAAADAGLKNLKVSTNLLQIPYETLDDIIARLGSEVYNVREAASGELTTFFVRYPGTEGYATAKATATNDEEVMNRVALSVDAAAAKPRLRVLGNGNSYSFVPMNTGASIQFRVQVSPPYLPLLQVKQSGPIVVGSGTTIDLIPTYAGTGTVTVAVQIMRLIHDDDNGTDTWMVDSSGAYSITFFVGVQEQA
jgi:hypothetical protein